MTVERGDARAEARAVSLLRGGDTLVYDIHGVTVSVSADRPDIQHAVHARLRHFPAPEHPSATDLTVTVHCQAGVPPSDLDGSTDGGRPVFDLPLGTVQYFEQADRLEMSHQDAVRVSCAPAGGQTQIWIDQDLLHDVWPVTHSLFSVALLEMLRRRARYGVHAAGLALGRAGLLLAGTSGAGKSTLTLALLRAGFDFMGDDTLFLSAGDDGLHVLAFPDEIDVTRQTASFFPELASVRAQFEHSTRYKRPVWNERLFTAPIAWDARPSVLVFPRVADRAESVIRPLNRFEALARLAPNVVLTDVPTARAHLDALAGLTQASRCFALETGRDLDEAARLLHQLMESAT